MIIIRKNDNGEWEWERVNENAEIQIVGPFDTVEECKADLKKHGFEKERVDIVGKAGIDYVVTLEELVQLDINSALEKIRGVDSRSIKRHLDKLIRQNLVETSDSLVLLRGLMSLSLAVNYPDDPFRPVSIWSDGALPLNLRREQIDVIAEFTPKVKNPGLRARLADVCWLIQKDLDMAEIAIDAYCESVERIRKGEAVFLDGRSIDDKLGRRIARDMMDRAAQISNAAEWKPKAFERFKLLLRRLLEDAGEKNDEHGFLLMGQIFLECENKIPLIERIAEIAEFYAKKRNIHPDIQNHLLRLADEARQKVKDKTKENYRDKGKPTQNNDSQSTHKVNRTRLIAVQKATPLAESVVLNPGNQKIRLIPEPVGNTELWKNNLERLNNEISDIKRIAEFSNSHVALIPVIERLGSNLEKYKNSPQPIYDEINLALFGLKFLEREGSIANDLHTNRLKKVFTDCALDIKGDVPKIQEVIEKRKKLSLTEISKEEQDSLTFITGKVIPHIEEEQVKQDMEHDVEAFKVDRKATVSQEKTFKIYKWVSRLSRILDMLLKEIPSFLRVVGSAVINKVIEIIFKVLGL